MKIKLILFLILIYYGILVSSQIYYKDITINQDLFQYDNGGECFYRFLILVGDPTNGRNDLGIINNNSTFNQNIQSINSIKFSTESILFEIKLNVPIGVYNHSFSAARLIPEVSSHRLTATLDEIPFFLNYECSSLPSNFDISNLSPRGLELDLFGKISAYYKYENVKAPVPLFSSDCYRCLQSSLKNNNNRIELSILNATSYKDSIPEFVFYIDETNKTYTPSSYFDLNVYDQITNIKSYPDPVELIIRAVKNYGPVFTFDSNNTHYTLPLYVQTAGYGGVASSDFNYRPISSKDGITKYIANYDLNLDSILYTTYAQNQSDYSYFISFGTNIFDESPSFMDSSYSVQVSDDNDYFTITSIYSEQVLVPHQFIYFNTIELSYPFGLSNDGGTSLSFKYSFLVEPISIFNGEFSVKAYSNDYDGYYDGFTTNILSRSLESEEPSIENIEFIHLFDHNYILRIVVLSDYTIFKIKIDNKYYYSERLVDKASINNSTYDFHVNLFNPIKSIIVYDDSNGLLEYDYYDIINLKYFSNPKLNNDDFDIFKLSFSKMLYNEIDVTNQTASNILYFNYTNINIDTPISLVLFDPLNNFRSLDDYYTFPTDSLWPVKWNSSISLFQVEFYVKPNSIQGQIPYALFFDRDNYVPSNILPESAQFKVISNNIDLYGPIFENIIKYPEDPVPTFILNSIINKNNILNNANADEIMPSYLFNIIDGYNGFKEGYITFRGNIDGSLYNFTFTANDAITGDKYNGTYSLEFHLNSSNCVHQLYYIIETKLFDEQGYNSSYSLYAHSGGYSQVNSLTNPFINYASNVVKVNSIYNKCSNSNFDSTSPELLEFELLNAPNSTNPIDVGSNDRYLDFKLVATDSDRGLLMDQIPVIYITTTNMNIFECNNATIDILDQYTSQFNYKCLLPIGFGYPFGAIFQIFTITSNGAYIKSFTTQDLRDLGFRYNINQDEIIMSLNYPSISGTNKIKSSDNQFWIYGRGYHDVTGVSLVLPNNTRIPVDIVLNLKSALKLKKPTSLKDISKCSIEFNYQSNRYYKDPYEIIITRGVENPLEDLPINPDQQCQGQPLCGGSSNGYCATTGCVCYSPWIGKDCLSQIIDLPLFEINQTSPTANITLNDNSIAYKSIVSIVALKEIDLFGKTVNEYNFDRWYYNKVSDSIHQYKTNISTGGNINVKLIWYEDETNITFANQQLLMNPNTFKYTIDIDRYPFQSKLNSLELIISASIESSKTTDICSSIDFGNTTFGDNSNYMMVQVDNKSLYARFIKRAIYDYITIRKVTNKQLQSDKPNNQYTSNSLIAISMSYFTDHITIDPDFGVLLNLNSASQSSANSICSNKNNGLSGSKIAGIAIGSVAFFAVIVSSVIYHYYKKNQQKKFVSNIQLKLNDMNKI